MKWKRLNVPGDYYAQQGSAEKWTYPLIHYNGPPTGVKTKADAVRQIIADARYHMRYGTFFRGTVNRIQYTYMVWEDTVYILGDPEAILYHSGSWPHNKSSYAIHVPIGQGETCSELTLKTLRELCDYLNDYMGTDHKALGHKEVKATSCPGWLQANFVVPYRNGENPGSKQPAPSKAKPAAPKTVYLAPGSGGPANLLADAAAYALRGVGVPVHVCEGKADHDFALYKATRGKLGEYPYVIIGPAGWSTTDQGDTRNSGTVGDWLPRSRTDIWPAIYAGDYKGRRKGVESHVRLAAKRSGENPRLAARSFRRALKRLGGKG